MTQPAHPTSPPSGAVAVSATFTADPLQDTLAFWFRELDWDLPIRFAPYNQVFQQLLDPASLLAGNRGGFDIVLVRFEDWFRYRPADGEFDLRANVEQLVKVLRSAALSFSATIIVGICPSSSGFAAPVAEMEELLRAGVNDLPAVHLLLPADVEALYPVADPHDPHADELGHIPYTAEYFAALGTALARRMHAIRATPWKVIALDCDDTLWNGVVGEDGPGGITLDPPRRALQEFIRAQKDAGMVLVIASKNDGEDVIEAFRAHPEMPLSIDDFVARRVNWEPKGANLAELAAELNLGLDSFLFVDDNHKECHEVRSLCPEVLTVPLPSEPAAIPAFLRHFWPFDHAKVTAEDRRRTVLYRQQLERTRLERSSASLEEFLRELQLRVAIDFMKPEELARVAQLTQRTNQMNLTSIRRTEIDLREAVEGGARCLTVRVTDRFGDYGLTGVVIYRAVDDTLRADTFLLSCRVLGRGVEHRVLARLGEMAAAEGLRFVELPFVQRRRNQPALRFLQGLSRATRSETPSGLVFRLTAEDAAAAVYRPEDSKPVAKAQSPALPSPAPQPPRPAADYVRIAGELREPARILAHVQASLRPKARVASGDGVPRSDLERELAALWANLLKAPSVGIHDDFFDLGGHSLLVVQLLARVRQVYGVDLALDIVYSGDFTVAELAKAIELKSLEEAGAERYDDLLREIESLSEEEVRALLAGETGENRPA